MTATGRELTWAEAVEHLASQPFSVLLGARLVSFGAGRAVLEVDACRDLCQQNGFLHGGVLAYATDNCLTYAAGTVAGPAVLTGAMTIDYLRPATGVTLRATAHVVHAGRRRVLCSCDLEMVDDTGEARVVAVARGTVYPILRSTAATPSESTTKVTRAQAGAAAWALSESMLCILRRWYQRVYLANGVSADFHQ